MTTVPGPPVKVMGNPHLEDVVAAIRALEAPHEGEHVLYVTEPTSVAAERATGDPLGWGYEERGALRGYLRRSSDARPARDPPAHAPGRAGGQVRGVLARFAALPLALSAGTRSTRTARGRTPSSAARRWRWWSRWTPAAGWSPSSRRVGDVSLPFPEIERLYP